MNFAARVCKKTSQFYLQRTRYMTTVLVLMQLEISCIYNEDLSYAHFGKISLHDCRFLVCTLPLLEAILATLMINVDNVAFLMNFYAHDIFREKLLNELTRKFGR